MKTNHLFSLAAIALILGACTTSRISNAPFDDAYYSPKNSPKPAEVVVVKPNEPIQQGNVTYYQNQEPETSTPSTEKRNFTSAQQQYINQNNDTLLLSEPDREVAPDYSATGETIEYDDYYDFSYAQRLKRFHNPVYGFSYYDPCYTDLYYYTYDPFYWGSSLSFGLNWNFGPSWGFNWGLGFGYPYYNTWYNPWGYNWYSPYYWGSPYLYGFGSYWMGYNNGYWNGYTNGGGYWGNNWNDNDTFYGRRTSRGSTNVAGSPQPNGSGSDGTNNRRIAAAGGNSSTSVNANPSGGESTPTRPNSSTQRRITESGSTTNSGNERNGQTERVTVNPAAARITASNAQTNEGSETNGNGTVPKGNPRITPSSEMQNQSAQTAQTNDERSNAAQTRYSNQRNAPSPNSGTRYDYSKYSRGTGSTRQDLAKPRLNDNQGSSGRQRTYTPPSYQQPRSSNNYVAPRNQQNNQPSAGNDNNVRTQQRPYSVPQNQSNTRTYTPPTRNNSSTYSTPSQPRSSSSGNSNYTPSRSSGNSSGGGSYTPSRSSGSGSSGSGSSGGGRRR